MNKKNSFFNKQTTILFIERQEAQTMSHHHSRVHHDLVMQ